MDVFTGLLNFIKSFVSGIWNFIQFILDLLMLIPSLFSALPAIVGDLIIGIFSIAFAIVIWKALKL